MNRMVSFKTTVGAGLMVLLSLVLTVPLAVGGESADQIAYDAYIYAYPLVLMDITRQQMTNVTDTSIPSSAPINHFNHAQKFTPVDYKGVVRPNFDTLYSVAWLELNDEPIILSVPNTKGRYYLMQMLDMWTDVFDAPGFRTTGTEAGNFAVVSPHWKGKLPKDVTELRAPTPYVWIIGRTLTNGSQDYDNVHRIQAGYCLTPLSRWGKHHKHDEQIPPVDPDIDMTTPPMDQVASMDGLAFFSKFAELLKKNPPHANDYPIIHRMKAIGVVPGKDFDPPAGLDLDQAAENALAYMQTNQGTGSNIVNGWTMTTDGIGSYGTSYLRRATVALAGLGANLPEDAIYPSIMGETALDGTKSYVLHFDPGQVPPVNAFWSLTLYDTKGFPVENIEKRYSIGSQSLPNYNAENAVDIYIQNSTLVGTDREAYWLPAPKENFTLVMRLYAPRQEVLQGQWVPPALIQVD